ncbi:MAG: hypothetical protein LBM98_12880 [Oscillospiraceae bacterium]|nr:hypothetical protein [Oscillospiraceae bacterium]
MDEGYGVQPPRLRAHPLLRKGAKDSYIFAPFRRRGCREAAGVVPRVVRGRVPRPAHVPAPCAVFASAAALAIRRTYRRAAIQCRGDNIQPVSLRIAGYYVNPGLLRRISLTTYRKCGGGFAKTVRRGAHPRTARGGRVSNPPLHTNISERHQILIHRGGHI